MDFMKYMESYFNFIIHILTVIFTMKYLNEKITRRIMENLCHTKPFGLQPHAFSTLKSTNQLDRYKIHVGY